MDNTFINVARYRINRMNFYQSIAFIHTTNKHTEIEEMVNLPFKINTKETKYLGINLT